MDRCVDESVGVGQGGGMEPNRDLSNSPFAHDPALPTIPAQVLFAHADCLDASFYYRDRL